MTDKNALVTGSTSGIGLAIAEGLAGAGMNVMLNGFGDADEIEQLRARLETTHGVKVRYSGADMTKPEEIQGMVEEARRELGQIDVLVNNAGIQHVSAIDQFPPDKWEAIIAINLSAPFYLTRAVLPDMKRRGWGRVINIASAHGLIASPFKAPYVASKHGLVGMTKSVALEVAEQNITVNAICPGYVLTGLVEKQIPDTARERGMTEDEVIQKVILEAQPTKKFVQPQELAALAVFLCSDNAASITGATLPVDGGWTAK